MSPLSALVTRHGVLALPAFFPDATRGVVRTVDGGDLEACGVQGLVVNAFHLSGRPGVGLIKQLGGIHGFLGWQRPVVSDSGGFQLMSMIRENPRYGTVSERGIHFVEADGRGEKVLFTPERSIRYQFDLGADLLICLDDCPKPGAPRGEVEAAVERTILWAGLCRREFDRLLAARGLTWEHGGDARPLLLGVIQGGYDADLREQCARELLPMGFDGFGFGGWPLTPAGELADEILGLTVQLVPDDVPRFALGVGMPEHVVRCYELGWRLFDCVLPSRDARHGRLYVYTATDAAEIDVWRPGFYRFLYVRDQKHKRAKGPISSVCDCPCCRQVSLAYLHHLFEIGDPLALRLATLHNLRFYTQLLDHLRPTPPPSPS